MFTLLTMGGMAALWAVILTLVLWCTRGA